MKTAPTTTPENERTPELREECLVIYLQQAHTVGRSVQDFLECAYFYGFTPQALENFLRRHPEIVRDRRGGCGENDWYYYRKAA